MKLLEDRIIKDGRILDGNIVKVDSFLNHQLDIELLDKLAEEMAIHFKDKKINKILTIEASGIALATVASKHFDNAKVVFCKKQKTLNIGDDIYESKVESFTTKKNYTITVSKRFLSEEDNILIIDDFLAEGNALKGLIDVANQSGSKISGISVAIEKGFQDGGKIIRDMGYDLLSLAIIDSISDGEIKFG
ncbi:MAG: xanthine phosphoribosyltransferase [Peptoniphilus harei]|jgi:xanthine phosphoribosyltransferase|uniref:xanthine phosphoribosyltransferase n=1 Tax=Peptoniphilus TaxID=162289 RepID=UPI0002888B27|nr:MULTISPECIES: xanthine phosphoribosyltransferase [Peptoniphilus]MBS6610170.1 xanthine phosphoribosyltransferase [Peptoniphilus harei]MDU5594633.1 xanthine phosphoribosyltransferase [Peptoniphilus rhinitidis]MDU7301910.1 xanthine phosphoribosyltransferase [Peptoniphilus lacydonensis]